MGAPPLRYLSEADVLVAMPEVEQRLELATTTMLALAADAQLPPKIGVHPAPLGSFGHAMPAWMHGSADDGSGDMLGMKWVVAFPDNQDIGLPAIHGTVILSDALTGLPRAVIDAASITAQRTAAISGVGISRWGPDQEDARVALIGAGVQARSHLPVISHLLPGANIVICDRDMTRLEALAADIAATPDELGTFASVATTIDAAEAVDGADLVLTVVSFGPNRQSIPEAAFAPSATVIAVDYDMCVPAELAARASLFLTDDREQFLANRTDEVFAGYPDPDAMIGEAIRDGATHPDGRILVSHLGAGLSDVVFGDAILRAAEDAGIGTVLPR